MYLYHNSCVASFGMFWNTDCKHMKIIYVHCGEETNISDPRSYEH